MLQRTTNPSQRAFSLPRFVDCKRSGEGGVNIPKISGLKFNPSSSLFSARSATTPITIFKPLNPLHGAQSRTRLPKSSPNSLQIIAQSPPSVTAVPSSATAGTSSIDLKLNKYSSRVTEPKSQGGSQAVLHGVGLSEEDMSKPQIGISSVLYEGNTCNMLLLSLSEAVKLGMREAGFVGFRFNTVGVSDAISMGTRDARHNYRNGAAQSAKHHDLRWNHQARSF
ncbi:dihydroxy-acid dehydratase, chloroplastic-like [Tripterygium wilfordii]|uniref:dihydroxy-acid dehydratase, chloroplastic-like n=1 Tax=Tripterygium wilfordii TaxID=458696 RepID=UPI0018F8032C|nr:dihydroxy-acid dehydratase, chloroplastic-like [Tripterygium wilfordii]